MKYASKRIKLGVATRDIAAEIGLNHHTLAYWRGLERPSKKSAATLNPVRIVRNAAKTSEIILHVAGARVEGLSVAELTTLLSQLR